MNLLLIATTAHLLAFSEYIHFSIMTVATNSAQMISNLKTPRTHFAEIGVFEKCATLNLLRCELKCAMNTTDMGTFDCPSRCDEFCKEKDVSAKMLGS